MSAPLSVIFAGGGTGGHITPSLAIARAITEQLPDANVLFLHSSKPIDARVLKHSGYHTQQLPAFAPPLRKPHRWPAFFGAMMRSCTLARQHIRQAQQTAQATVLVSLGGYVAPPAAYEARKLGIPIITVCVDALPGKANALIARKAHHKLAACVAQPPYGWQKLPPIVRPAIFEAAQRVRTDRQQAKREARRALGLAPDKPTLLVTGGSLGAKSLNEVFDHFVQQHRSAIAHWQILHQTGPKKSSNTPPEEHPANGPAVHQAEFIVDMPSAWAAADVALARAGASTVSEAWAFGLPSVFLPYPYHADNHQHANAEPMAEAGAAQIITDLIEPTDTLPALSSALLPLLTQEETLSAARCAGAQLPLARGHQEAAKVILACALHRDGP